MAGNVIQYTVRIVADLDQLVRDAGRISTILRSAVSAGLNTPLVAPTLGGQAIPGAAFTAAAATAAAGRPAQAWNQTAAAMTTAAAATARAAGAAAAVPPTLSRAGALISTGIATAAFASPQWRAQAATVLAPPWQRAPLTPPASPRMPPNPPSPIQWAARPPIFWQNVPQVQSWRTHIGPSTPWPVPLGLKAQDFGTQALAGGAKVAATAWHGMDQAVRATSRSIFNLRNALVGLGMYQVGRSVVGVASTFEQLRVQFTLFYGSAIRGQRELAHVVQLAKVTPFNVIELAEAKRLLRAYQVEGERALMAVADTAAATNRPLQQVAMAIGRIRSGVYGEGFELLRRVGVSRQELEKQGLKFSRGGYYEGDPLTAINAVIRSMEVRFGGMSQALVKTWKGAISNIKDAWTVAVEPLGTILIQKLTPKIEDLTNWVWRESMDWKKGIETNFASLDLSSGIANINTALGTVKSKIDVLLDLDTTEAEKKIEELSQKAGGAVALAETKISPPGLTPFQRVAGATFGGIVSAFGALGGTIVNAFRGKPFDAKEYFRETYHDLYGARRIERMSKEQVERELIRTEDTKMRARLMERYREIRHAEDLLPQLREEEVTTREAERKADVREKFSASVVGLAELRKMERAASLRFDARFEEARTAEARLRRGARSEAEARSIEMFGGAAQARAIAALEERDRIRARIVEEEKKESARRAQMERLGLDTDEVNARGCGVMDPTLQEFIRPGSTQPRTGEMTRRVVPSLDPRATGVGPASARRGDMPITSDTTTKPPTEAQMERAWRQQVRARAYSGARRGATGSARMIGGGAYEPTYVDVPQVDSRTYNIFGYFPMSEMAGYAMRDSGMTVGGGFR